VAVVLRAGSFSKGVSQRARGVCLGEHWRLRSVLLSSHWCVQGMAEVKEWHPVWSSPLPPPGNAVWTLILR